MSKYILIIIFFLGFASQNYAQKNINDYGYVAVPDLYEFLYEKDQHQLNSLTKFLFNKYGFNAYFLSELPNVKRCDGLFAEIDMNSGFVYTKMEVVLKDCNGVELYRSQQGRSKLKEYKKAYHQALRAAFDSFADMDIDQKDIVVYEDEDSSTDPPNEVIKVKPITSTTNMTTASGTQAVANQGMSNLPRARFSSYTHDGKSFLLRKTSEGYSLYEESTTAEDGLLLIGKISVVDSKIKFSNVVNGTEMDASFDRSKNLIIGAGYKMVVYKAVR